MSDLSKRLDARLVTGRWPWSHTQLEGTIDGRKVYLTLPLLGVWPALNSGIIQFKVPSGIDKVVHPSDDPFIAISGESAIVF